MAVGIVLYSYEKYIDKLQGGYLDEFKKSEKIIRSSSLNNGEIEESMYEILDLFIKGQDEKSPVSEITGGNLARFCSKYTNEIKIQVKKAYHVLLGGFIRLILLFVSMLIITIVNHQRNIIKSLWRGQYDTGYIASFLFVSIGTSFAINIIIKYFKVKDHDDRAAKLKKYELFISALTGIILVILKAILNIPVIVNLKVISSILFFAFILLCIAEQILYDMCIYSDSELMVRKNIKFIKDKFKRRNKGSNKISRADYLKSYASNRVLKKWIVIISGLVVLAGIIFIVFCDTSALFYLGCLLPQFFSSGSYDNSQNGDAGIVGYLFNYKYEGMAIEQLNNQ